MKLLLIRHGKAQPGGAIPDHLRALTEEGKLRWRRGATYLAKQLRKSAEDWQIYSSFKIRAKQTAEILAEEMGNLPVNQLEFIGNGNEEELLNFLAGQADEAAVILVGHEPHLSDWAQLLTGRLMSFSKGAVLEMEMSAEEPLKGKNIKYTTLKEIIE